MTQDKTALLPCPWCGATPDGIVDATKILGVYRIIHRCKVIPPFTMEASTPDRLAAAWNTRPVAAQATLSDLDAAGFVVVPKGLIDAVRGLLRSEYESAEPGLTDCIDNEGKPYQSAYLANQIKLAETALAARSTP